MRSKVVDVYISGGLPSQGDMFVSVEETLEELCALSPQIHVLYKEAELCPMSIQRLSRTEFKKITARDYGGFGLKFSATFSTDDQDWEHVDDERNINFGNFTYLTVGFIRLLLIYTNIAKPGALNILPGDIITTLVEDEQMVEKARETFLPITNFIAHSSEIHRKYGWPPIVEFPLKDVFKWLKRHWVSFDLLPTTKLEIALNAFSYLFHLGFHYDTAPDVLFSLIGLEALYVEGDNNITRQVVDKSQILLGKLVDFKKMVSKLYDYRSKFIHGELKFINRFSRGDVLADEFPGFEEMHEYAIFGGLLLLPSIQKFYELGKDEIEFHYILKP